MNKIHKMKNVIILSNGSISFSYKTPTNFKAPNFLEKDNKNYSLNMKNNNSKISNENFPNYKNKYFKTK